MKAETVGLIIEWKLIIPIVIGSCLTIVSGIASQHFIAYKSKKDKNRELRIKKAEELVKLIYGILELCLNGGTKSHREPEDVLADRSGIKMMLELLVIQAVHFPEFKVEVNNLKKLQINVWDEIKDISSKSINKEENISTDGYAEALKKLTSCTNQLVTKVTSKIREDLE